MTPPPRAMTCARPDCTNPVPPNRTGRPAIYCSPACRPSHRPSAVTVEVDHPDTSPDGRPPERVWTVRLRRGEHIVVIADGLGWPTATALARQLDDLLTTRPARDDPRPAPGQETP
jgi:hypothetical protein